MTSHQSHSFGEDDTGPMVAENAYDDAMAKLNASLQRSATIRGSSLSLGGGSYAGSHAGSLDNGHNSHSHPAVTLGPPNYVFGIKDRNAAFLHDVDVDVDAHSDEFADHDQLPSIEEARTTAASTLSRVERSFSNGGNSPRSARGAFDADDYYNSNSKGSYGPNGNPRIRNWYKVAFFVLTAAILGSVIGIAIGFTAGKEVEKLEEEATQGTGPGSNLVTTAPRPSTAPRPNSPPTPDASPVSPPTATPPPTRLSTPAPTGPTGPTMRFKNIVDWLKEQGISAPSALEDSTSHQYLAAAWMADADPLALDLPISVGQVDEYQFIERYVLAVFYHALKGQDWSYNFKFFSETSVCEWNVDVSLPDKRTLEVGIVCDSDQHVISINIPQNNLIGSVVSELGLLTRLNFLALNHNVLSGSLPLELGDLRALTYLALHYNELEGSIPSWLGDLTSLRVLGMGDNNFKGSLPATVAQLTNIVTLGMDNNELTGDVTPLYSLTKLERMYLQENSFQQDINDVPWSSITNLQEVDLSGNQLAGTIPPELLDLPALEILDLGDNKIVGSLPSSFSPNSPLRYLALYNNLLTQSIPASISQLSNLTHLDLSDNDFTGIIPHDMRFLQNLQYLFLANNDQFTEGLIPTFIGELPQLTDLSLKGTARVASLSPALFTKLSSLVLLELDSNKLTGTIPTEIGLLSSLTYLLLNHNAALTGTVPTEVQLLPQLEIFLVGRTLIEGDLNPMCFNRTRKPEIAGADCGGGEGVARVECKCCNICCQEGVNVTECRDRVYFGQLDPVWQDSFQRRFYQFSDQDFGQDVPTLPPVAEEDSDPVIGIGDQLSDGSEEQMPNDTEVP